MTYKLVLVRHGESEWNAKNLFTGWVDVPLSEKGTEEAKRAGKMLKDADVLPDLLFTSLLRRAIMTANLSLDAADRHWIPVKRNWRLNERHYGALQGKNKRKFVTNTVRTSSWSGAVRTMFHHRQSKQDPNSPKIPIRVTQVNQSQQLNA